jgi:acetyl esterase/lipase
MRRRTLLGLPTLAGLGAASTLLGGCGGDAPDDGAVTPAIRTIRYGDDPSQYVELSLPDGTPCGVVVVIHGGFWRSAYDLSLGRPLAESLSATGFAALNIEYRRVGNGGGVPQTLDDVRAAIGTLAQTDLDTSTLVTLGHSAGGHLAAWAGGRVDGVTHVISQAGVLDLVTASEEKLGDLAVDDFLGHPATAPGDADVDPTQQLPLGVPVWCVHAEDDRVVPFSQSEEYVAAATAAGATAELVRVKSGGHFVVIDVESDAWARTLAILDGI